MHSGRGWHDEDYPSFPTRWVNCFEDGGVLHGSLGIRGDHDPGRWSPEAVVVSCGLANGRGGRLGSQLQDA